MPSILRVPAGAMLVVPATLLIIFVLLSGDL
jgi:hypothetical protein